jgi:hypothetical protein
MFIFTCFDTNRYNALTNSSNSYKENAIYILDYLLENKFPVLLRGLNSFNKSSNKTLNIVESFNALIKDEI